MKTFDCVEMKRRGAEEVQQALEGMTLEEELGYWQSGTEELQQRQQELRLLRQIEALPPPELITSANAGTAQT